MTVTSKSALATELGISKARVSQYVRRGMPVLPDGKLDRERALRWVARSHYQRYGSDHGARRAKELVQDGYAGERQDGDATEWYRLDRNGRRVVVRREEQWERLGFRSADAYARWQRGIRI